MICDMCPINCAINMFIPYLYIIVCCIVFFLSVKLAISRNSSVEVFNLLGFFNILIHYLNSFAALFLPLYHCLTLGFLSFPYLKVRTYFLFP